MFSRFTKTRSGDSVSGVKTTGRRALLSTDARGFSLIELVLTITIMTILTLGVVPLVKVSIKRQREQRLHDTLRQIRMAIDEFHRDTIGSPCVGGFQGGTGTGGTGTGQLPPPPNPLVDPRSKVYISDCTIFGVDNPDHYPPDLDTLVNGVNVLPRVPQQMGGAGIGGRDPLSASPTATKKKVYHRESPLRTIT